MAYALAAATFFAIGLTIGAGLWTTALAQVIALGAVPLVVMHVHGLRPAGLGLTRRPPLAATVGAAIIGLGLWWISLRIALPIVEWTGTEAETRRLSQRLLGDGATPVPVLVIATALVPGVCEEIAHRGLLLGALAPRLGRAGAVVVAALPFAALHIVPARMASAALLGIAAGAVAVAGRSLWPAITLHVVNNSVALVVGGEVVPGLTSTLTAHPDAGLVGALGLCGIGSLIAWRGRVAGVRHVTG